MAESGSLIPIERIEKVILFIRGNKVMFRNDLAALYGVGREQVQAVKRNAERYPEDFAFQLAKEEVDVLKSQNVISSGASWGVGGELLHTRSRSGGAMLSSVLRSPCAAAVNVQIMRTFVRLRRMLASNADLARKLGDPGKEIRRPVQDRLRRNTAVNGGAGGETSPENWLSCRGGLRMDANPTRICTVSSHSGPPHDRRTACGKQRHTPPVSLRQPGAPARWPESISTFSPSMSGS